MNQNCSCPSCNSDNFQKKFSIQKSSIRFCNDCHLQFLYPFLDINSVHEIYNEGYFKGQLSGVKGYQNYQLMRQVLEKEAKMKINFINKLIRSGKLLDVGAGTGIFLEKAKKSGWEIYGNDISSLSEKEIKTKVVKYFKGSIEDSILPTKYFDVITAWDVLEHISNIGQAVQNLSDALKSGGYLFITTPNTESIDAKIMGKNWYGYKKIPEHILFFNKKSITRLLENNGFEVVSISSWGFVRSLGFLVSKLENYSSLFRIFSKVIKTLGLSEKSLFLGFTDFMVVAQKR